MKSLQIKLLLFLLLSTQLFAQFTLWDFCTKTQQESILEAELEAEFSEVSSVISDSERVDPMGHPIIDTDAEDNEAEFDWNGRAFSDESDLEWLTGNESLTNQDNIAPQNQPPFESCGPEINNTDIIAGAGAGAGALLTHQPNTRSDTDFEYSSDEEEDLPTFSSMVFPTKGRGCGLLRPKDRQAWLSGNKFNIKDRFRCIRTVCHCDIYKAKLIKNSRSQGELKVTIPKSHFYFE